MSDPIITALGATVASLTLASILWNICKRHDRKTMARVTVAKIPPNFNWEKWDHPHISDWARREENRRSEATRRRAQQTNAENESDMWDEDQGLM